MLLSYPFLKPAHPCDILHNTSPVWAQADAAVRGRYPVEDHRRRIPEAQRQANGVGKRRRDDRGHRARAGGVGAAAGRRRKTVDHSHVHEDVAGRVLRAGHWLHSGRWVRTVEPNLSLANRPNRTYKFLKSEWNQ